MTLIRLAWSYLRKKKPALALIIVLQFAQVFFSLWLPNLNAHIIDDGIIPGNSSYIWKTGGLMLAVSAAQIACIIGAMYVGAHTALSLARELRYDTFRHVQKFSTNQQHKFGSSTLITRATNDITQIQTVVVNTFAILVMAPLMGLGGIIMAIIEDRVLSLLLLVVVPLLAILIFGIVKALTPRSVLQQERIDRINILLREKLMGVRVIRAFTREESVQETFCEADSALRKVWLEIGILWALLFPLAQLIIGFSSVGVVWFGGQRIADGLMNVGALTAYISYLMMIMGAVLMSGFMVMLYPRGQVSATRLTEIRAIKPEISSPAQAQPLPANPHTFTLNDVSLRYPGAEKAVLSDINITLEPAHTVAIVGSTGSGKSSLLRLLPRLLDPTSGSVELNGCDIRQLDLHELRSIIAYVPQKTFLFTGTIASNVSGHTSDQATNGTTYTPDDLQRIEQALKIAQAWEFVSQLPETIYASVEAGGVNFSGGQRQRLAIARAIYRCLPSAGNEPAASLLIFDDSFSALDNATDARLRANLPNYLKAVTTLIVGQRISSIRHAHCIYVLDEGRIVGAGTHTELLANNQVYQEIVASQMSHEEALS